MTNLKTLLKDIKLDYVNIFITEINFPPPEKIGEVEIIHFGEYLTTEEVEKKLDDKGYRPANIYELLTWAKDWNGKDWVVAFGSRWQGPSGHWGVPCLRRDGAGRGLGLYWVDGWWAGFFRFAAVSKSLKPLDTSSLESRVKDLEAKFEKIKEIINQ